MFQNGELIGATECVTLQARCLINRCRHNRARMYCSRWLCGPIVIVFRWWARQVTDKITVVWDVTPCTVVHGCQVSSETSIPIYKATRRQTPKIRCVHSLRQDNLRISQRSFGFHGAQNVNYFQAWSRGLWGVRQGSFATTHLVRGHRIPSLFT